MGLGHLRGRKEVYQKIGNAQIEYERIHQGQSLDKYTISLVGGSWPSDSAIICALGGNAVFGGSVKKTGKTASVTVHTD